MFLEFGCKHLMKSDDEKVWFRNRDHEILMVSHWCVDSYKIQIRLVPEKYNCNSSFSISVLILDGLILRRLVVLYSSPFAFSPGSLPCMLVCPAAVTARNPMPVAKTKRGKRTSIRHSPNEYFRLPVKITRGSSIDIKPII